MCDSKIEFTLDARGLNCPMPLLKLKQQLNGMSAGQIIEVLTTDAGSVRDFDAFVKQARHIMVETSETESEFRFVIQKQ